MRLSWVFKNASPTVAPRPITSPVLFISGPSTGSTQKRSKGKTGALTAYPRGAGSSGTFSSFKDFPAMTHAPTLAQGTPVALLTKGTVREARGFTSNT